MASRYFRRAIGWDDYRGALDLVAPPGIDAPEPQWNIAPNAMAPIIRRAPDGEYAPRHAIQIAPAFWSIVPVWWKKPLHEKTFASFNARAAEIVDSAVFSGAFRHGRCLVPASGYYLWSDGTPFAVQLKSRDWFYFAGVWNRAMIDGSEFDTFAIVTTEPNLAVSGLAMSMPVILSRQDYLCWLDGDTREALQLLRPFPSDAVSCSPAHPAVGNVRNQGPELTGDS